VDICGSWFFPWIFSEFGAKNMDLR
jgi:hypothetical protein